MEMANVGEADERKLPSRGVVACAVQDLAQTIATLVNAVERLRRDVDEVKRMLTERHEPWNMVRVNSE